MKNINFLLTGLLLIATVFFTQQANAQAPSGFTYQSVLRDANNDLIINTSVGTQLSILQSSNIQTVFSIVDNPCPQRNNGAFDMRLEQLKCVYQKGFIFHQYI